MADGLRTLDAYARGEKIHGPELRDRLYHVIEKRLGQVAVAVEIRKRAVQNTARVIPTLWMIPITESSRVRTSGDGKRIAVVRGFGGIREIPIYDVGNRTRLRTAKRCQSLQRP